MLSSSFHNGLHGARVLAVPLSSIVNNTALHRLIISPNDTRYGQIIKVESNLLFDYTSMISPKYLKPTQDGLQPDALKQTLTWWHQCIKLIVPNVWFCFSVNIFIKDFLDNKLRMSSGCHFHSKQHFYFYSEQKQHRFTSLIVIWLRRIDNDKFKCQTTLHSFILLYLLFCCSIVAVLTFYQYISNRARLST